MEKYILKRAYLLLLPIGIFYSCMTHDALLPKVILPPEVIDARLWYDKQGKAEGIRLIAPDGNSQIPLFPDWEQQTFFEEDDVYQYLGVNLNKTIQKTPQISKKNDGREEQSTYVKSFSLTTSECGAKFRETGDARYLAFSIRLIIRTNKQTSGKHGFVMTVNPDLSYLEMHLDSPFKDFTYLKRGEEFNGMIMFYEMDGTYSNGWKYVEGKGYSIVIKRGPNNQ